MKARITNLRDERQAIDIHLQDGTVIRCAWQPGETKEVLGIDPFAVNRDKLTRTLVQEGKLEVIFLPEDDDLVPLTIWVDVAGTRVGTFQGINLLGGATATVNPNDERFVDITAGGGGTAASVFDFGADRIGNTTTTRYLFPGYAEDLAETSSSNEVVMPRSGTLRNLYVIHNVLGGGPVVITYTVEVNGVATSLAVGLAANSALGANTTISVPVVAGDRVRVRVTKAANVAGPNNVHATVEIA